MSIKYFFCLFLFSVSVVHAANFEFYGSNKHLKYNINEVSNEISKEYKRPILITTLIVASKECGVNFKKQFEVIESLDAEKYGLIFISACANDEREYGYHTSISVALTVLNNDSERLLIYSPDGIEVYNGDYILTTEGVLELIQNIKI